MSENFLIIYSFPLCENLQILTNRIMSFCFIQLKYVFEQFYLIIYSSNIQNQFQQLHSKEGVSPCFVCFTSLPIYKYISHFIKFISQFIKFYLKQTSNTMIIKILPKNKSQYFDWLNGTLLFLKNI